MTTITIKNIPDDLYEQLKIMAAANRRSINSEIIVCIERRLGSYKPSADAILQKARRLRKMTEANPITDSQFNDAKLAGRL